MISLTDQTALRDRAEGLQANGFNGFDFVLVEVDSATDLATLEVHFHNNNALETALTDPRPPRELFSISGGRRVRGGAADDQIHVEAITKPRNGVLELTVTPIGDYSTYTLRVGPADGGDNSADSVLRWFDPVLGAIDFKFRPGCFNLCAPEREPALEAPPQPRIGYMAKDYDSFRHVLMTEMEKRIPGWEPTSEADLTQVLISQIAAAADELSDMQDRVLNEAYFTRTRSRVSLARHARLVDYHVHQGNQAATVLAAKVAGGTDLELDVLTGGGISFWAGKTALDDDAVVFLPAAAVLPEKEAAGSWLYDKLNELTLYDWSGAQLGLEAGATEAQLAAPSESVADRVVELINDERTKGEAPWVDRLLIEERLNPATGRPPGRNPAKRQLLQLLPTAAKGRDPIAGAWYVTVEWRDEDKLAHDYCFLATVGDTTLDQISAFHGNLIDVLQGRREVTYFTPPDADGEASPLPPGLPGLTGIERVLPTDRTNWGAVCRLPSDHRLLYRDTPPRSEYPPRSTLRVDVDVDGPGSWSAWEETITLVLSDQDDAKFAVETDELTRSAVRFGNKPHGADRGTGGLPLPAGSLVRCTYQVGNEVAGNVGMDTITRFGRTSGPETAITACRNPLDVTTGRAPEPAAEVVRNAPEAYRTHQLRAVTLQDYVDRAEQLEGVARAAASYGWTGSWRTVRVTIDPVGTEELPDTLRSAVANHLAAVRLIGEDLELRGPVLVPLNIAIVLCARNDIWPEDLRADLERELSDGFTHDGRRGLFHPDEWTFGQALHSSQLLGRIHEVMGVDHVVTVAMARWGRNPATVDKIETGPNEIISVRNDRDHMERGMMALDIQGGRS